jgi:hypothetical protein
MADVFNAEVVTLRVSEGAAYGAAVFAVGLGLGAAFVPTDRRGMALTGAVLGCLALLAALLVGRALGPG